MIGDRDPDAAVRAAAFAELERLVRVHGSRLPWSVIARGFQCGGENVRFANRAVGIFKPRQMDAALSIKTVVPRAGRRTWYRDQVGQPDHWTGLLSYDLALGGREDHTNRTLEKARRRHAPLIWFLGVEAAVYEPLWPVWVEKLDWSAGRVLLAAADCLEPTRSSVEAARAAMDIPANEVRERPHVPAGVKRRNHLAWFSSRTRSAYGHRCAFSGLPLSRLLVGARILPDAEGGPPEVTNGICMSTLHHTAFDADLIGVDAGCRIHVARSVRAGRDGPLLDSLKALDGTRLRLPGRLEDRPAREYLDWRFRRFLETAD